MRARKFWKRYISVRYILATLIVICVAIVGIVYFAVDLEAYEIPVDNMEFDTEGFEDYSTKDVSEMNEEYIVGEMINILCLLMKKQQSLLCVLNRL